MTKEEVDLIITEQNKSREEILKAVAKVKADYHELCKLKDMRIAQLEQKIEKMKCCENCDWYYLQQHWRESKEINESRMFHCGTCGHKTNWKPKEIKEK